MGVSVAFAAAIPVSGNSVLIMTDYATATNRSAQIATAAGCHQGTNDGTFYWSTVLTNSLTQQTGLLVPDADTNKFTSLERAAMIPYATNWTGF